MPWPLHKCACASVRGFECDAMGRQIEFTENAKSTFLSALQQRSTFMNARASAPTSQQRRAQCVVINLKQFRFDRTRTHTHTHTARHWLNAHALTDDGSQPPTHSPPLPHPTRPWPHTLGRFWARMLHCISFFFYVRVGICFQLATFGPFGTGCWGIIRCSCC